MEVEHHVITIGEAQIRPTVNRSNKSVVLPLLMTQDTATDELLSILRSWVNHRFAVVLKRIDDDEQPALQQKRRTGTSESTVGELPASGGDLTRDLAAEFESAAEASDEKVAHKYSAICHGLRNDPRFRGFLFDFRKVPLMRNPVLAMEWVRREQHKILGVDNCAKIYPGTRAEAMLLWLLSAYESDKNNRPIPSPPEDIRFGRTNTVVGVNNIAEDWKPGE